MAKEVAEDYASSLADLTVNSKPLINMLTILAEENIDHAGVIVETVEKHLEKVHSDIKLPVLYLVDSIVKNVGGEYVQKFAQVIVNMFTKTFKQVDEKTRSQMYKLRETWFEVFPATKLYQLDVKVNLIDPAWPIQQYKIHVNPNFLKKPIASSSSTPPATSEEDKIKSILALKEEELLMLKQKKTEMEQEQARRQREQADKNVKKVQVPGPINPVLQGAPQVYPNANGVLTAVTSAATVSSNHPETVTVPVKQRLGPPVHINKTTAAAGGARIAPVSGAMLASVRRDPRLARHQSHASVPVSAQAPTLQPSPPLVQSTSAIAPNVFDIKPLTRPERITKRKNVITIDVRPDAISEETRARRDPRIEKRFKAKQEDRAVRAPRRTDDRERARPRKSDDAIKPNTTKKCEDKSPRSFENEQPSKTIEDNEQSNATKVSKDHLETEKDFDIDIKQKTSKMNVDEIIPRFPIVDSKKINKLPPIPKITNRDSTTKPVDNKDESIPPLTKKRKEGSRNDKRKKREKDRSNSSSPDKKSKILESKDITRENKQNKAKEELIEIDPEKPEEAEVVTFKELKNYHKERYMRRNKESSESPERAPKPQTLLLEDKLSTVPSVESEASNIPEMLENKDVDLRILQPIASETKAAGIAQKRPSVENCDVKIKKNKMEKFDILFGDEDVDLRQLPQVEDTQSLAPPLTSSSEMSSTDTVGLCPITTVSPTMSPKQKDWAEVKETKIVTPEESKKPSQLDLVRAKLAEATKGKDRLGRPLLFHSTSGERRRTISSEDIDLRPTQNPLDAENDKESIKIIMSQAEEQFKVGNIDKEEYKTLVMQVLQLNERLKLKEAKQRESLEVSKRKLQKASQHSDEEMDISVSPNRSPQTDHNTFGDIDERITPHGLTINRDNLRFETPILNMPSNQPDIGAPGAQDSDLRVPTMVPNDIGPNSMIPAPPRPPIMPPMFMNPYSGMRRGPRPRSEEFNGPRMRGRHLPPPAFSRGKFTQWNSRFDSRMPALPRPMLGTCQGECPLRSYNRSYSPPPLGAAGKGIPPTDFRLIEYIDQDPMKTIDIDSIPREIRFYGNTAVIMLEWDDPREIKFLPGTRRITFDNKDSVVLGFNEDYTNVDIDDHEFRIKYGAPTRELYINDRWYECFFGGPPMGIMIDGKLKVIQLEGPPPQVDIGKEKKTNLVAGKINLIVDGQHMFPVFLDAKPQKFNINGTFITLRFVDSLKTVLINEKPFKVEFGGLPKPIFIGKQKHFIRFSVLPRCVKPGHVKIENMEGKTPDDEMKMTENKNVEKDHEKIMETDDVEEQNRPEKIPSPEAENSNPGGLDILASLMPSSMAPASQFSAGYSLAEPLMPTNTTKIPGLDTPADENPPLTSVSFVNDLFAKLVASGIVQVPNVETKKVEDKPVETKDVEEPKSKPTKEDKNTINRVDFLRPATLKIKQPGLVARLYGGMQCSGCGARFPPEHTVRYSQHLDWHFRQNRRERDSARRAHSRHWHYDLSDWVQYEEIEDLEEREKSWFETGGAEGEAEGIVEVPEGEAPSVPAGAPEDQHCALCGDKFDQFYNEDKEEWHLRKAVRHEDKNYHPLCFEDYKASLTKEEPSVVEISDTTMEEPDVTEKIIEETIEIKDIDEINSQSDNESVVEVIESESLKDESQEPLEIPDESEDTEMKELSKEEVNFDDGDEDDVVLKADPVEQVVVDDDADTDDETQAERAERDRLAAIDFSKVKVKIEPIDPDEEPVITAEEEAMRAGADTTHTTVLSSIDGNLQLEATVQLPPALPIGGIRINITKPITFLAKDPEEKMLEDISPDNEPPPPGEEPELDYTLKPTLEGVTFLKQPPVQRGSELSGLCSIM